MAPIFRSRINFVPQQNRREIANKSLELRLERAGVLANQLFDFGELVIEPETLLVGQCVRGLDDLARNNLLDGKLHFLEVDRRLQIDK
jgi:hypothetical protein